MKFASWIIRTIHRRSYAYVEKLLFRVMAMIRALRLEPEV